MNIKTWCKSFLSIYHIIPTLTASIDKLVYLKSVNSSNFHNYNKIDTLSQVEAIASLTQRKVNLINLKVLTDETLLEMDANKRKMIVIRYIDNVECKKAIELSGYTRRSYFRALRKAMEEFEKIFKIKIIQNRVVYNSLINEKILDDIFCKIDLFENNIKFNEDFNLEKYSNNLCNFIINRFKKVY